MLKLHIASCLACCLKGVLASDQLWAEGLLLHRAEQGGKQGLDFWFWFRIRLIQVSLHQLVTLYNNYTFFSLT